jgi:hypothetical protein
VVGVDGIVRLVLVNGAPVGTVVRYEPGQDAPIELPATVLLPGAQGPADTWVVFQVNDAGRLVATADRTATAMHRQVTAPGVDPAILMAATALAQRLATLVARVRRRGEDRADGAGTSGEAGPDGKAEVPPRAEPPTELTAVRALTEAVAAVTRAVRAALTAEAAATPTPTDAAPSRWETVQAGLERELGRLARRTRRVIAALADAARDDDMEGVDRHRRRLVALVADMEAVLDALAAVEVVDQVRRDAVPLLVTPATEHDTAADARPRQVAAFVAALEQRVRQADEATTALAEAVAKAASARIAAAARRMADQVTTAQAAVLAYPVLVGAVERLAAVAPADNELADVSGDDDLPGAALTLRGWLRRGAEEVERLAAELTAAVAGERPAADVHALSARLGDANALLVGCLRAADAIRKTAQAVAAALAAATQLGAMIGRQDIQARVAAVLDARRTPVWELCRALTAGVEIAEARWVDRWRRRLENAADRLHQMVAVFDDLIGILRAPLGQAVADVGEDGEAVHQEVDRTVEDRLDKLAADHPPVAGHPAGRWQPSRARRHTGPRAARPWPRFLDAVTKRRLALGFLAERGTQVVAEAGESDNVLFTEDTAAFADAYARALLPDGAALPYVLHNATGGLGARRSGRGFGVEIEFDFPPGTSNAERRRRRRAIGRALREAGLVADSNQADAHTARTAGYSAALWTYEEEPAIGGELVSPVLYDEERTWIDLATLCRILTEHGAIATVKTGLHVTVGTADFDQPYRADGEGGRSLAVQVMQAHGGPGDRVQYRLFDGTLDPAAIQALILLALAQPAAVLRMTEYRRYDTLRHLVHTFADPLFRIAQRLGSDRHRGTANCAPNAAAPAGVDLGAPDPLGSHRRRTGAGVGPGQSGFEQDTASLRDFVDRVFTRTDHKLRILSLFARNQWQDPAAPPTRPPVDPEAAARREQRPREIAPTPVRGSTVDRRLRRTRQAWVAHGDRLVTVASQAIDTWRQALADDPTLLSLPPVQAMVDRLATDLAAHFRAGLSSVSRARVHEGNRYHRADELAELQRAAGHLAALLHALGGSGEAVERATGAVEAILRHYPVLRIMLAIEGSDGLARFVRSGDPADDVLYMLDAVDGGTWAAARAFLHVIHPLDLAPLAPDFGRRHSESGTDWSQPFPASILDAVRGRADGQQALAAVDQIDPGSQWILGVLDRGLDAVDSQTRLAAQRALADTDAILRALDDARGVAGTERSAAAYHRRLLADLAPPPSTAAAQPVVTPRALTASEARERLEVVTGADGRPRVWLRNEEDARNATLRAAVANAVVPDGILGVFGHGAGGALVAGDGEVDPAELAGLLAELGEEVLPDGAGLFLVAGQTAAPRPDGADPLALALHRLTGRPVLSSADLVWSNPETGAVVVTGITPNGRPLLVDGEPTGVFVLYLPDAADPVEIPAWLLVGGAQDAGDLWLRWLGQGAES